MSQQPASGRVPAPRLEHLADEVYAYVQPDGGWCLNNAGVVVGDGEALLVDTAATEARTLALRDAVRGLTDAPVRTVVNTHHHGDHTHGNYVFADTARIIGHEQCAPEVVAQDRILMGMWPDVDWGRIDIRPPDELYTDRRSLSVGDVCVELEHIPPAHTTNDTVVWLPDAGVLFTGDLVFSGGTPFLMMGSVAGALAAVERLREFGAVHIVPGHGPVGGGELLDATERYLSWLAETAARAHSAGQTPLEAAAAAELGEFAELRESERLVANLHRAYAELDGAQNGARIELAAAITDMVKVCGGRMPECLA